MWFGECFAYTISMDIFDLFVYSTTHISLRTHNSNDAHTGRVEFMYSFHFVHSEYDFRHCRVAAVVCDQSKLVSLVI